MTAEQRYDQAFEMGPDYRIIGQDWDWKAFPPYREVQIFTGYFGFLHLPVRVHEEE